MAYGIMVILVISVFTGFTTLTMGVDVQPTNQYIVRNAIDIFDNNYVDGVSSGNGTESNPYVIEGWEINGTTEGYSIVIEDGDAYATIKDCYIYGARDQPYSAGIILISSNNITIENCTIEDCDIGISIDNSTNVDIRECNLDENGKEEAGGGGLIFTSVEIITSDNIAVSHNMITNDYSTSIRLYNSYNCVLEYNTIFNGTKYGIDFTRSWSNIIRNNNVSYCLKGLYAVGDNNGVMPVEYNTIYNNSIANNIETGIFLMNTENNTFYFNNLIDNDLNVLEYNEVIFNGGVYTNIWYSDRNIGNYYSDYTGTDTNGDGIGEEPYVIKNVTSVEINLDPYPLVKPYNGTLPILVLTASQTISEIVIPTIVSIIALVILILFLKKVLESVKDTLTSENPSTSEK